MPVAYLLRRNNAWSGIRIEKVVFSEELANVLTESGLQRHMVITSTHGETLTIQRAYARVHAFFSWLKATATQLTHSECWQLIVTKSMEVFMGNDPPDRLPQTG